MLAAFAGGTVYVTNDWEVSEWEAERKYRRVKRRGEISQREVNRERWKINKNRVT